MLRNGDGFAFVSGSEVTGFRGDICEGLQVRCKKIPGLHVGARLYRNLDSAFEKEMEKCPPVREIRVDLHIIFRRLESGFSSDEIFEYVIKRGLV